MVDTHATVGSCAQVGRNVHVAGAARIGGVLEPPQGRPVIIEDNVFIGSDTQLIAPVRIARNSTIGAGSTITKDTPADKLTLSRAKQTTLSGWVKPVKKKQGELTCAGSWAL